MTQISESWLDQPETFAVMSMLSDAGYQAYFVGGCVRNALLGAPVSDLDISTDALPDRVIELARTQGLNAVSTGYDHGTITVISGGIAHEVTTFRKDVETDGRRATVAFSKCIADDARRRDFTMNALYSGVDGVVLDPLGGLPDLLAGRVRFIEDADARIREDHLRSLRFFRFHAWYGDPQAGLDPDALAAISGNIPGLDTLSKERVGAELLKLLAAPDPGPAICAMGQTGVLNAILPGASTRALPILIDVETGRDPNPIRRLASLGGVGVADALRLSRPDTKLLTILRKAIESPSTIAELGYWYGKDAAVDVALLRAALFEISVTENHNEQAEFGAGRKFPVEARDLMPDLSGPALGQALKEMEDRWIKSGFQLTRTQLLDNG